MRSIFAYIIILTFVFFIPDVKAGGLSDALSKAYKNNPTLKAARAELKATDENIPQAYAGWMPTVTASYERSRENEKLGNNPESHNIPGTKQLSLVQPVFSGGGTLASINQAKNLVAAGRSGLLATEQQVLLDAITAYTNVVRAREVLELSENNEKVLNEQLEAAKSRFDLGEATITDVAQAESRLSRAESDRIDADGNLIIANSEYKRIFGTTPPAEMMLPDVMEELPTGGFKETLNIALENNPSLRLAEFNVAVAEDNIKILKSDLLPTVDLRGNIERRDGLGGFSNNSTVETESVTLNFAIPLFQSGAEYSRIRQAKSEEENARYQMETERNSTIDEFTSAWRSIQTARGNIKANRASVKATKVALDGVKEEYHVGSRTVLDVLNAEQELFVSQVNLATAMRDGVISVYRLKASMGELTAEKMGLDVELYDPEEHYNNIKYKMIGF